MAENHAVVLTTGKVWAAVRQALHAHAPLVVLVALYAALAVGLRDPEAPATAFEPKQMIDIFSVVLPMFVLAMIVFLYARLMIVSRGRSPLHIVRQWGASTPWLDLLVLRFPLAIAFLVVIQVLYVSLKVNIPFVAPFSWDGTFAQWDRALFFGQDPWVLTHAIFSTPKATAIIDALYIVWFFAVYLGFLVFAALPMNSTLRLGFMLAFGLAWAVGGSLLATVFSSAGPVYMDRLFGDPTFEPLMERLRAQAEIIPLKALNVQETLWLGYAETNIAPIGISAFPSMHNCSMVVIVMGFWRMNRWAGALMALFSLAIVLGSVHLGWHYFVDSLAGVFLGVVFWLAGMWVARWWMKRGTV
ncbi:MAG: phosphatase PAP2 family protein [Pseudomonadota bacterium]